MNLRMVKQTGLDALSSLYVALLPGEKERTVEFAEAVCPPLPRSAKWVLIVSTASGCPVKCRMCDAGSFFNGFLSAEEILAQVDHMAAKRFGDKTIEVEKFKIQFARMGEPLLNPAVPTALRLLPDRLNSPGIMPCISTVAPASSGTIMEELISIKNEYYGGGRFQMQFSIHTTDIEMRDRLIPIKKMPFPDIAAFGGRFFTPGDRKITLNFAAAKGYPINEEALLHHFDPAIFLIKITPVNPTLRARENELESLMQAGDSAGHAGLEERLTRAGYQVIVSYGEEEENAIGTNCGQFAGSIETGAGLIAEIET